MTLLSKNFNLQFSRTSFQENFARLFVNTESLDKSFMFKVASFSIIGIVVYYFGKIRLAYNHFEKIGLKSPKPRFFYGNHLDILKNVCLICLSVLIKLLILKCWACKIPKGTHKLISEMDKRIWSNLWVGYFLIKIMASLKML